MAIPRKTLISLSDTPYYHCVSRCVRKAFLCGDTYEHRRAWVEERLLKLAKVYCIDIAAYAVMSNHYHVLVEVPPKVKGAAVAMTDEDFLAKIKRLYSRPYYREIEQMLQRFRDTGSDKAAMELKAKYTCRMHDLSEFMKGLKQRFSQWFNRHHGRRGTLWEGRFKSVLVQDGYAARVMAAYIDLNPIRAAMVERPEDYKWCSYGEAMKLKYNQKARAGLCRVLGMKEVAEGRDQEELSWEDGVAERCAPC